MRGRSTSNGQVRRWKRTNISIHLQEKITDLVVVVAHGSRRKPLKASSLWLNSHFTLHDFLAKFAIEGELFASTPRAYPGKLYWPPKKPDRVVVPSATCAYTHDTSDSGRFPDLDREWSCDRLAVKGTELCVFHLPRSHKAKTPERIDTALEKIFAAEERAIENEECSRRVLGANLPNIQFSFKTGGGQRDPIDFRESSISGTIDCTATQLDSTLRLDGSRIEGDVLFQDAVIERDIQLEDAEITGRIDARRSEIRGRVQLDGAECAGRCILFQARVRYGIHLRKASLKGGVWHGLETEGDVQCGKATFEGPLNAERSHIGGDLSFNNALLKSSLRLADAEVNGATSMNDTHVLGSTTFAEAELDSDVDLRTTVFRGKVDFREAEIADASFGRAVFTDKVRADRATFTSVTLDAAQFRDKASLGNITITADASLDKTTITDGFNLDGATIEGRIRMRGIRTNDGVTVVDCTEAELHNGVIDSRQSDNVVFDFTRATLGDVQLRPEQSNSADGSESGDGEKPFGSYRFLRTTFDGFDFTDYDTALEEIDWELGPEKSNTIGHNGIADPTVADREKTYTKAKKGASEEGATRAAGAFLMQELRYRRKGHATQRKRAPMLSREWRQGLYRWLANWVLRLTAGYGERLSPVLGTTVVTIGLFASVYALLLPRPPYDAGLAGYVLLSLNAFVTLVLGEVTVVGGFWVQLLAQIEGLLGAFLIALFVFVFTRAVHR